MLRLGCIERKKERKTEGVGEPGRATAHFGSSVLTEKILS